MMMQSGLRMDGLRRMLGRFGLSGHHHLQPIQKLSGAIIAAFRLLQHRHLIGTVQINITTSASLFLHGVSILRSVRVPAGRDKMLASCSSQIVKSRTPR